MCRAAMSAARSVTSLHTAFWLHLIYEASSGRTSIADPAYSLDKFEFPTLGLLHHHTRFQNIRVSGEESHFHDKVLKSALKDYYIEIHLL